MAPRTSGTLSKMCQKTHCGLLVIVSCVLLCACVNGLAGGENKAAPTPLVYETYKDAGRYLFDPTPQNWTDASKVCRAYNGHLAFPKTQDEADALWSIMTRYNVKQVHAGFHDQFLEGEYYTAKGRLMNETSFNKWSVGAPIGGLSLNCGGLRDDGLVDVACTDISPSICEENEPSGGEGFLDYEYIEGHGYYKLYPGTVMWLTAMQTCYKDGSHLLILNSEDERVAVWNKFNLTTNEVWIGAHHLHADRDFVTIFDDPLESTGYFIWQQGEPSGSNVEFPYLTVRSTGYRIVKGVWGDLKVICEYKP